MLSPVKLTRQMNHPGSPGCTDLETLLLCLLGAGGTGVHLHAYLTPVFNCVSLHFPSWSRPVHSINAAQGAAMFRTQVNI